MEKKIRMSLGAEELVELGRGCGPGMIRRAAFTRKDGTKVKSSCVPDKGAPGKTPASKQWARFRPNYLPGWGKDKSDRARHEALKKATRREDCRTTILKLNQLANVTTDRPTETKARKDMRWLHKQGFCKLKTKNR